MDDKRTTLTEEELKLLEETERFLEAIDEELEMENVELPANMYENIWKELSKQERIFVTKTKNSFVLAEHIRKDIGCVSIWCWLPQWLQYWHLGLPV